MFCGISETTYPAQICLHTHDQEVTADVAYDIDSYLGFASSLAFAKQGIHYQPAPQIRQNMQTDVHLYMDIENNNPDHDDLAAPRSTIRTQLRKIPHFMLGRAGGTDDTIIYIIFPNIIPNTGEFRSLTY